MTKKLSAMKINRILSLHLKGHNQTAIGKMLHIDQSAVSKYIGAFKAMAEQRGLESTLLEFGVQDKPEEIQMVVEEFQKSDLTIADVQVVLQIEKLLRQSNIKPEDYRDFIEVCKKTKDASYLGAAIKVNKLENETGMSYEQIVTNADKKNGQLKKCEQELEKISQAIKTSKLELEAIKQETQQASDEMEKLLAQFGVYRQRLEQVEALALALKDAAIPDEELSEYIERQKSLNKAALSIHLFHNILEKAKVATEADGGKLLLNMLAEFPGLAAALDTLQTKKQQLSKAVADLEPKAQFRSELVDDISKLKADKASLQPEVSRLLHEKNTLQDTLDQLKNQLKISVELRSQLEYAVLELMTARDGLETEIKIRKDAVSDLDERKSERDRMILQLNDMQTKIKKEGRRWDVFEWFLGMVQAKSKQELSKLVRQLPGLLLEEIEKGKYPVDFFKDFVLEQFSGSMLRVMKCTSCGARFMVNKQSPTWGYSCPRMCGGTSYQIIVDKDASAILKKFLSNPKPGSATSPIAEAGFNLEQRNG